jgi:drug/metabolite transporter (DMT)-like permease
VIGVTTIVAQMLTIAAMAYTPVALVALITLSTPLVIFPYSMLVLRSEERIGARMIVGAALALGGMAVIVLR